MCSLTSFRFLLLVLLSSQGVESFSIRRNPPEDLENTTNGEEETPGTSATDAWVYDVLNHLLLLPWSSFLAQSNGTGDALQVAGVLGSLFIVGNHSGNAEENESAVINIFNSASNESVYENVIDVEALTERLYEMGFEFVNLTATSLNSAIEPTHVLASWLEGIQLLRTLGDLYTEVNSVVKYVNSTVDLGLTGVNLIVEYVNSTVDLGESVYEKEVIDIEALTEILYEMGIRVANLTATSLTSAIEPTYALAFWLAPRAFDDVSIGVNSMVEYVNSTVDLGLMGVNAIMGYVNSTVDLGIHLTRHPDEVGELIVRLLSPVSTGISSKIANDYLTRLLLDYWSHFISSERCLERVICLLELDQMFSSNILGKTAMFVAKAIPGESTHIYEALHDVAKKRSEEEEHHFSCGAFVCEMADHTLFEHAIQFLTSFFAYLEANGCLDKLACILGIGQLLPDSYSMWAFFVYANNYATQVTAPVFSAVLKTMLRANVDTCDDIQCAVDIRDFSDKLLG